MTDMLPPRPRLTLRVGFAGIRELDEAKLEPRLVEIFRALGDRLADIAPGTPAEAPKDGRISQFYSTECPLLRLVTGLCEGADDVAARVFDQLEVNRVQGTDESVRCLDKERAGILPFSIASYRRGRPKEYHDRFDELVQSSTWIMELDGIFDSDDSDDAKARRSRGYRAQGAFMLRNCDFLVAATDPTKPVRAGSTLETVRDALALSIPVVFVDTRHDRTLVVDASDDLDARVQGTEPVGSVPVEAIGRAVDSVVSAPGRAPQDTETQWCLEEYFDGEAAGPRESRVISAAAVWSWFEGRFKKNRAPSGATLPAFERYRARASQLNSHYAGLYRGTFLLTYLAGVVAVFLATLSLALLATWGLLNRCTDPISGGLLITLLGLALAKFGIVFWIVRNTSRANEGQWSDRAVDYRDLAERLRSMFYLPYVGSHRASPAELPQYASRVVRQSAADWLFDAITRSVSPTETLGATEAFIERPGKDGPLRVPALIRPNAAEACVIIGEEWIGKQALYHRYAAETNSGIREWAEDSGEACGHAVLWIVGIDIVLVAAKTWHLIPHALEPAAKTLTPFLIFVTALLPAIIASLNGIRSQSECERLAERSKLMEGLLHGRREKPEDPAGGLLAEMQELKERMVAAKSNSATDPGSWDHELLRVTERADSQLTREVSSWSTLYSKELNHV